MKRCFSGVLMAWCVFSGSGLVLAVEEPVAAGTAAATLLSMGPDPGGHTGELVTPKSTRTDNPKVDAMREQMSGGKTETSSTKQPQSPSSEK